MFANSILKEQEHSHVSCESKLLLPSNIVRAKLLTSKIILQPRDDLVPYINFRVEAAL
jgi:hypothetical protein